MHGVLVTVTVKQQAPVEALAPTLALAVSVVLLRNSPGLSSCRPTKARCLMRVHTFGTLLPFSNDALAHYYLQFYNRYAFALTDDAGQISQSNGNSFACQ
jgi:hypothetical protein